MAVHQSTVLVVDNAPAVLEKAKNALEALGFETVCLDHGRKLLKLVRKLKPDLILMASTLDNEDAIEINRQLIEDIDLVGIPIVIMNDPVDPMGAETRRELGITDYIRKPFAPEALQAVVDHAVNHPTAPRPQQAASEAEARPKPATHQDAAERVAGALRPALLEGSDLADQLRTLMGRDPVFRDDLRALLGASEGPVLAGELASIPVAEVFQLLALQRQSGVLSVWHRGRRVRIALQDGKVRQAMGENMPDELLLGHVAVRNGLLTNQELDGLLRGHDGVPHRLGERLVRADRLSQKQLQRLLEIQSAELVYGILRWGSGRFSFAPGRPRPEADTLDLALRIEELLMEGFRRVDEWGLIESALPSFDAVLYRLPAAAAQPAVGRELETAERTVLAAIDGRNTVRQVIANVGWGTFEVARVLYRLLSARLIGQTDGAAA